MGSDLRALGAAYLISSSTFLAPSFFWKSYVRRKHAEAVVVVVGAGLTTALGLHKKGVRSLVLDSSPALRTAGFAFTTLRTPSGCFDTLGVGDKIMEQHLQPAESQFLFRLPPAQFTPQPPRWQRRWHRRPRAAALAGGRVRANHRLLSSSPSAVSAERASQSPAELEAVRMTEGCVRRLKELHAKEPSSEGLYKS